MADGEGPPSRGRPVGYSEKASRASHSKALPRNTIRLYKLRCGTSAGRLERMTPQLYVQSVATFELIADVMGHATLFYCQRIPRELAAFHWVIDGKGKGQLTDWESWWSLVVLPVLQSRSLKQPLPMLNVGDYSPFERFRMEIPEYMKPHIPPNPRRRGSNETNDLRKIIKQPGARARNV